MVITSLLLSGHLFTDLLRDLLCGEKKMLLKALGEDSSADFSLLPFDAEPLLVEAVFSVATDLSSGMHLSGLGIFTGDGGFWWFFLSELMKLRLEVLLVPLARRLPFLVDLTSVVGMFFSLRLPVRLDIFIWRTLIPPMELDVSLFCERFLSFI